MKVTELLQKNPGKVLSIEIEPPEIGSGIGSAFEIIDAVKEYISYVDITYHSQRKGGHRYKPGTLGVAGAILGRYKEEGIFPVPHAICTSFNTFETQEYLLELYYLGVENVVALRGDPPKDDQGKQTTFRRKRSGHAYAKELIGQIGQLRSGNYFDHHGRLVNKGKKLDFCVGAACFPEGNSKILSVDEEILLLAEKVDAGADYFVTQMFFDNEVYFRFCDSAGRYGLPIIPGLKPITTPKHLETLPQYFKCSFPKPLREGIERFKGNPDDVRKFGIESCVKQCEELREQGAPSLHFYAARKAPIKEVIEGLR